MREHGSRPAGKDSRHPFSIAPNTTMAEREDPSVEHNKLAVLDPALEQTLS
jgi:hypothetical protein